MNRISDGIMTSLVYEKGDSTKLGATVCTDNDGVEGVNFAIYSEHALSCSLVLFRIGEKLPFAEIYLNDMKGLNIYLTSNLTPSDYETQIANPAAYSLINNNEYTIVIDINEPNIEELFCHELMHNIEFNLENKNIKAFYNWENLNPENFYYLNSYTSPSKFNYTLTEESKDLVYFIDLYSHSYPSEDRSRIFEHVCTNDIKINDYINLKNKANYLKEEILKYYPMLKNSKIFT